MYCFYGKSVKTIGVVCDSVLVPHTTDALYAKTLVFIFCLCFYHQNFTINHASYKVKYTVEFEIHKK